MGIRRKRLSVVDENMKNYFTSFRQLTHLGISNICAAIKISYANALSLEINRWKKKLKKERDHFKQRTSNKKGKGILTLFGTTGGRFTEPLLNPLSVRDLFGVWTKLKESIFKSNNRINSTVTTRTWLLSIKWTRTRPVARAWYMNQKMMVPPPFLESWILFFRMRGCCILLTKMKAMSLVSLCFSKICCQYSFSEIFKEKQVIPESCRNLKCPIKWLLWWHKTLPGASEKPSSCKVCKKSSQRRRVTILVQVFESSFCSFFLVFLSGLSCTYGSQFRSIFKTLSNIPGGGFCINAYGLSVFNYHR